MRRLLFFAALLLSQLLARGQNEITAVCWITNTPAGLTTNLNVNAGTSDTRYFTNNTAGVTATHIMITNVIGWVKTNTVTHISGNPLYTAGAGSPQIIASYNSTNNAAFNLTGPSGTNFTVTMNGTWGFVTYFTNVFASAQAILNRTNAMSAAARTNAANAIVNLLSATTTSNSIPVNAKALTNYLDLSTSQQASNKTFTHTVLQGPGRITVITNFTASNVFITNVTIQIAIINGGTYSGFIGALTNGSGWSNVWEYARLSNAIIQGTMASLKNGYWTNGISDNQIMSNAANYGVSLVSQGSANIGSQQFGYNCVASGTNSLALGNQGAASARSSIAISGSASGNFDSAFGDSSFASGGGGLAVGFAANKQGTNSMVFGNSASDGGFTNAMVFGAGAAATAHNQIVLGAASHVVVGGGTMAGFTLTNTLARGTNVFWGDISFFSSSISSIANGHNTIAPGTNVYVRLTGSPSQAWTLGAISGGNRDGKMLIIENATAQDVTIQNESGTEPTAANRILTYAAANGVTNVLLVGNGMMGFIYSGTLSRWLLMFPSVDVTASVTNSMATNSAPFALGTNDFALNTYYTNSAQRSWVSSNISMTNVLASDKCLVSLFLDQDGDGNWEMQGISCRLQGVALVSDTESLSAILQPNARFMFTNQSTGGGVSAIVNNSSQWARQ